MTVWWCVVAGLTKASEKFSSVTHAFKFLNTSESVARNAFFVTFHLMCYSRLPCTLLF